MAFRGIQSTNIISEEVGFTDPILILNKDGSTAVDVGFLGKIGATSYAGLVKDSSTDEFLLINSISLGSTSVNSIDATDLSLVKGDLTAGAITATSFTGDGSALTGITDTDTTYSVGDGGLTQKNFTTTLKNKLDTIETLADVTDTANVTSSGALMTTGGTMTGAVTTNSTFDGRDVWADGVVADAALPKAGGAMTGTITNFTSTGIDDNADALAITIDSSENVGIGQTSPTAVNSINPFLHIGNNSTAQSGIVLEDDESKWEICHNGDIAFREGTNAYVRIGTYGIQATGWNWRTVSASDPTATSNPDAPGTGVGHLWINSSSGESYVCTDATTNDNVWYNIGGGSGGIGGTSNLALSSGLVGNYDYEFDSSVSSWNNEDGTAPSASSWGNVGSATVDSITCFAATNGGFDIPTSGNWWQSTSFTIQAWVHLRGYNSGNTGIVSQFSGSGRHNWMWNSSSDRFHMNGCKGSTYAGNSGGTGTWRMLTLRYDDGYTYTTDDHLYTATSHSGSGDMCTSSASIAIGARDDHVEPADYGVRKVVFYDRALSDAEVTQNWDLYKSYVGRS